MSDNTNIGITVEEWARIVIERWENRITTLNIKQTGQLLKSFTHFINTQANGDPERITFAFEYYGKFVDMGVGKGTTINQVGSTNRKPKPWYSKIFWSQFEKLKEILVEKYQMAGQMTIISGVEEFNMDGSRISGGSHPGKHSYGSGSKKRTSEGSVSAKDYDRVRMR